MTTLAGKRIERLGMGCWAIGGPFYAGTDPLGYANTDDAQSTKAIHAAYEGGVRYFDTADVYGAGHSETLLGEALVGRDDAVVSTKFGLRFDPATRQVTGPETSPAYVNDAIEASLRRLRRDRVDLVFLHLNALAIDVALPMFDALDQLVERDLVGAYGWSTDFPEHADAVAGRSGFVAVQHAMNLFFDAPSMRRIVEKNDLSSIVRSPLAMGVLTGKFDRRASLPENDVRQNSFDWMDYFKGGTVVPALVDQVAAVRDLLTTDGRTLAQGALGWLWALSDRAVPIPGARTVAQALENASALEKGPLPPAVMDAIEGLVERGPEGPSRER